MPCAPGTPGLLAALRRCLDLPEETCPAMKDSHSYSNEPCGLVPSTSAPPGSCSGQAHTSFVLLQAGRPTQLLERQTLQLHSKTIHGAKLATNVSPKN